MDLQTALICGGVAAFSAIVIYVTSIFSMREKTYEEAIAEQRKMPEENLLLGRSVKDKAKEKKQKKLGKKVKEKTSDQDKNEQADSSSKSSAVQTAKVHVDFQEPEAEVVSERPPQEDKKKKKKEKVKPILLNKDEHSLVVSEPPNHSNHFEEILPKDDLLLKRKESRDESSVKVGAEPNARESKVQVPLKSGPKAEGSASNKQEKEKVSTKAENIPTLKAEKSQVPKKQEVADKDKDNGKKQEKVSPKTEKSIKSEKQTASKSEKPAVIPEKTEKAAGKTEKADKTAATKSEKSSNAKAEKSASSNPGAAKPEKSVPAKLEKQIKAEKTQESATSGVSPDAVAAVAASESAATPAPSPAPVPAVKEAAHPPTVAPAKERRNKKKSELATLQQMSSERDGINMSLLLPIVQKAELSRSEIQILIDQLLNKQQNAGVSDAEWIEGRQDPVQKLKKQLAEKEKALAEEQEALQGVQAKLKELRVELNGERSRLSHSCRQLEEALQTKTQEAQALTTRLQHAQETTSAEKQALTHQVQQLQQKLTEEHSRLCQLQEQEANLQQELLAQRQQVVARLADQEATMAAQAQTQQLVAQLKEQEALALELQTQRDQLLAEIALLRDRVAHAEKQALVYKDGADEHVQELTQQLEELNMIRGDLEHRLSSGQQHETALQFEANKMRKEMEDMKAQLAGYESLINDVNRLRTDNDKFSSQLMQMKDLQLENQRLRDENERLASQVVMLPELQREALQLREENENLAAQVTAMTERPAAEGRENGDLQFHEEKHDLHKRDFSTIEKTIQQKEGQILQLTEELQEKSSLLKKLQSEVNTYKTDINKLNGELEGQRNKNNEISQKISQEQHNVVKQLLQRIFPDIRVQDCKSHEAWLTQFESAASAVISELQSRVQKIEQTPAPAPSDSSELIELEKQNNHLQGLVANYKNIIDGTAGMLKQLQNQVEEGEIRWRQQLQVKEAELEAVRQELGGSTHVPAISPEDDYSYPAASVETQVRVEDLQTKLKIKEQLQQELELKFSSLTNSVQLMKEEKEELSVKLQKEQEKSQDLTKELVKLRALVQIGKDSLNQEQEMVVHLQQQVDKLNGIHQNHNVASNGPSSESSTVSQGGSGKK